MVYRLQLYRIGLREFFDLVTYLHVHLAYILLGQDKRGQRSAVRVIRQLTHWHRVSYSGLFNLLQQFVSVFQLKLLSFIGIAQLLVVCLQPTRIILQSDIFSGQRVKIFA